MSIWIRLCVVVLWLSTPATAQDVIHAMPGENVTLHTAFNVSGTIYVRAFEADTGEPATVHYWSIKELWNTDRGFHTGNVQFEISGFRDELRAGGLTTETVFLVTADVGVWAEISNRTVEVLCETVPQACP